MENTTIAIIAISVLTLIALIGAFKNMKNGFGPFNLKVYGITLVIGIAGIIVLTDLSSDKTAPVFGLLGAIAGYLFGLRKDKN